jgi:iron complex transport system permease protein
MRFKSSDDKILSKDSMIETYHHGIARKIALLLICIIVIVLVIGILSVSVYNSISLTEAYKIIWDHIIGKSYEPRSDYWWADRYIWNRVLPRAVIAITAGASLAICGALMQSVMNNPLADPYSTGISSGACFGAVMAIIVGVTYSSMAGEAGIVTNAFIGAMIPAMLIILLSERINASPATMILIGTALSYFFNSMMTYIMVTTDADTLQSAYLWQVGSLDGLTWSSVPLMLIVTVIGSSFVLLMSKKLNILSLGENSAMSLGLDVHRFRMLCLILMAIMTAAVISFTGVIGFIGIIAPHMVRILIGSDNKYVLPISMAMGAMLLLMADYVAMCLSDIPVGVIMCLIGSPIFFILILWQKKSYGAIY